MITTLSALYRSLCSIAEATFRH